MRGGREGEEEQKCYFNIVPELQNHIYAIHMPMYARMYTCANMHVRTLYVPMHFHNTCRYADRVHMLTLQAYVHRGLYSSNIILMIMLWLCVVAELTITFWKCLDIVSRQTPECSDIHIFDRT